MEKKIVKIDMLDCKNNKITKEFELKPYGTPFQAYRDYRAINSKHQGNEFEANFELAMKYFPHVIGKEAFDVAGLDENVKFSERIEEYFINDGVALEQLCNEVVFFLNPSLKSRIEKLLIGQE